MSKRRPSVDDCLRDCNESQVRAITHVDGPLLILAGAGSGKTRVITRRTAYLISQGVRPSDVLAITFTNKAAGEMRERIRTFCEDRGLWVSTFHSACARMLRAHAEAVGFRPSFSIYDTGDTQSAVKQALADLNISKENWPAGAIAAGISRAKGRLLAPQQFAQRASDIYLKTVARVYKRYDEILRANNAMDFDDLLMKVVVLLRENASVRKRYQERFRHVLIDEFQDTNPAQYAIVRILSEAHRNICATGDPDQSIYGWRGADITNILNFERDYPDAKVVRLEQNYRSTKTILHAASDVIAHNKKRKPKDLWTENADGGPVRVYRCDDGYDEASQIAADIRRLVQEGSASDRRVKVQPADMAIFYRTNAQSRLLEAALRDAAISYQIVAGVAFFDRKEVKDVLAYLRLIVNPADDVSAERIVNVPPRGLGGKSIGHLKEWAAGKGQHIGEALAAAEEAGLKGMRGKSARDLAELLDDFRGRDPYPVAKFLLDLIEATEYLKYLRRSRDPDERIANVEELINAGAEYDRTNPEGSCAGFLEQVALVSDIDRWDKTSGAVTLMTLHAAKGLEFPVVYITGLEDGLLPLVRGDGDTDMEEERRLFFVGITRAKRELVLTYAEQRSRYGQSDYTIPSRFLDEVPQDVVEEQTTLSADVWDDEDEDDADAEDTLEEDCEEDESPARVSGTGRSPRASRRSSTRPALREGDRVRHAVFGTGRILALSGSGRTRRATVHFATAGVRHLVLQYAKLEKI